MDRIYDTHCHLGFCADAYESASQLSHLGVDVLSMSLTPREYMLDSLRLKGVEGTRCCLGFHPWQVTGDDALALFEFESLLPKTRFVGEVGLDFSPRWVKTRTEQVIAFSRIVELCALDGVARCISIHAVQAVDECLDIIQEHGLACGNTCVLHSFNGTHQQLLRAIESGCWFSIGPRFLSSKKGRAYLRTIPVGRLLLETDMPSKAGEVWHAAAHKEALDKALCIIAGELGMNAKQLSGIFADNCKAIWGL